MCTTACAGSCAASATIDCQVSCQSASFATCETEVVEECKTYCATTGGGIFCDGQCLTTGDLGACADQLRSELDVTVDLSVTAHAEATADANCSVSRGSGRQNLTALALIGLLVGLRALRVVKRRG